MLNKRLVSLRKKKKWTQKDIAGKLNISRSAYAGYEIGRRVPEYSTLENMANLFEVSIDYLVGRTEEPKGHVDISVIKSATLDLYRNLSEEQRRIVDDMIKVLANQQK